MGLVHLEDLKPRMITSEQVVNSKGTVIIGAGALLSEKTIRILKMWGIAEIDIKNAVSKDSSSIDNFSFDPKVVEFAKEQSRYIFRHTNPKQRPIRIMYKLSVLRLLKNKPLETIDAE